MRLIVIIFFIIGTPATLFATEDWTYELSPKAKEIFKKRVIQIPCEKIPELLKEKKTHDLYFAIRDAGIFKQESCRPIIRKHKDKLMRLGLEGVISFYLLRLGDRQQLNVFAEIFDEEVLRDFWVIELLGFLDDWDVSGKRLVKISGYSDGAASEVLCSAIMWRRYLYGEKIFKQKWYEIGKEERIKKNILDYFYETCK
jgi:hypothetical protein